MADNQEDIQLLICQCMKSLFIRQEKILVFSRVAYKALWKRGSLEQDDAQRLRTLQEELDGAQTVETLQELNRKLDAAILALKVPQKNS